MAEENESAGGQPSGAPDTSGLAIDLAIEEARSDPTLHGHVAAFLADQRSLIAVQKHHLHEQFKQVRLGVWQMRLGVLLRIATAAVGTLVAGGIAFLVWDASQSNGLLIEPFSVPPDLASRGLTGNVIAARLLDRLQTMQRQTSSQRAPQSYANSWAAQDIKMELPEAGISLDELDRFLREKLGNDTHVTGDVAMGPEGITLTARAGADGAGSVTGPEASLDVSIQKLAETVYQTTQPYRYAVYLATHERRAEGLAALRALAAGNVKEERTWAYNLIASTASEAGGAPVMVDNLRKSIAEDPTFPLAHANMMRAEDDLGHPEASLAEGRIDRQLLVKYGKAVIRPEYVSLLRDEAQALLDKQLGDFKNSLPAYLAMARSGIPGRQGVSADLALNQAALHEISAARDTLANPVPDSGQSPMMGELFLTKARTTIPYQMQDWSGVVAAGHGMDANLPLRPGGRSWLVTAITPFVAIAEAHLGRLEAAQAAIAATPADCYRCLIARGTIAALAGEPGRADWWFARAVAGNPSIPFAEQEWGRVLLDRGKPDDAIAQFTASNQKGPHFADALEGWGEALMAKNQSHLALAKFAEAEKYAPNWGRLHLKWGEALGYAGKKDDAAKQFARAAQLDLTSSEKAELAQHT